MTCLRLGIEPVPAGSRLATLAKLLPRARWNRIRRAVYHRAGYHCRICCRQRLLYCHEVWQYNRHTGYQWLRGFQALCGDCHNVKHILFVPDHRKRAKLLWHFATVNQLTSHQAEGYLKTAQRLQKMLNQRKWIVNFCNYNWRMPPLKSVHRRQEYLGHSCPSPVPLNQEPTALITNYRRLNQAPSD